MAIFRIRELQRVIACREVEADDEEQAMEKFYEGEGRECADDGNVTGSDLLEVSEMEPSPATFEVCLRGMCTASFTIEAGSEGEARTKALELAGFETDKWSTPDWEVESVLSHEGIG